jgi:hypothetical protein
MIFQMIKTINYSLKGGMKMSFICECGGHDHCGSQGISFPRHIDRFVGETVTIFTTSGGASGSGFTGVILSVNSFFVRLVTEFGEAPANPFGGDSDDMDDDMDMGSSRGSRSGSFGRSDSSRHRHRHRHDRTVGSVVDIPIDRIVAFCHNAV